MSERMSYVDMARGIAIILVMIGHSVWFPACGAIHIPTFFVLAGYVITMDSLKKNTCEGVINKRALRLLYPYFFYSGLLLIFKTAKSLVGNSFNISELLKDIFGILYSSTFIFNRSEDKFLCFRVGNEGLWFLTALVVASVVFYLIIYKVLKVWYRYAWMAFIMMLLVLFGAVLDMMPVYLPWGFDIALFGVAFMLFGMIIRNCRIFESVRVSAVIALITGVLFLILNYFNGEANMAIHLYGRFRVLFLLSGICSSMFVIAVCRLMESIGYARKGLAYVGRNTLCILAFHTMVFGIFEKIFEKLGIDFTGLWVIRLVITLAVCLVAQLVFEKILRIPRKFL